MRSGVRRGLALLEAVAALFVIGVVAAGALALFAANLRAAAREPALLTATALAQDRLAAVRLLDPRLLRRLPDSLAQGRFQPPFADYRWRTDIRRDAPELYDVRVEVTWSGGTFVLGTRLASAEASP